jgi:hypothetical protein
MRGKVISAASRNRIKSEMSRTSARSVWAIAHLIAPTLVSGIILIGTTSSGVAQLLPDPWIRDGGIVGGSLGANVHLVDGVGAPGANKRLADAAQRLLSEVRETHYQHETQ